MRGIGRRKRRGGLRDKAAFQTLHAADKRGQIAGKRLVAEAQKTQFRIQTAVRAVGKLRARAL